MTKTTLKQSPHFYPFANRRQFDIFCRGHNLTPSDAVYLDRDEKVYGIDAEKFHKIVGVGPDVSWHTLASRGFKYA